MRLAHDVETYKVPSRNMPDTAILCFEDICNSQTKGKGMIRMITSTITSEMDRAQKLWAWLMQVNPGVPGGAINESAMGVHSKRMEKKKLIPHIAASPMAIQETIEKAGPRKMRR